MHTNILLLKLVLNLFLFFYLLIVVLLAIFSLQNRLEFDVKMLKKHILV